MHFINPVDVLQLNTRDQSDIKKAKRRKLAEFDLNDGVIEYRNKKINKSDFIHVTEELEDLQKLQFYWEIRGLPDLEEFLVSGDTWFFASFKKNRLYSNSVFIDFISPYFSTQYDKAVASAFIANDSALLRKISATPPLFNDTHRDQSHQSLKRIFSQILERLIEITDQIETNENDDGDSFNVEMIYQELISTVKPTLINACPNYFKTTSNEIALRLRQLSVVFFNNLDDSLTAIRILSLALKLNLNALRQQGLLKDYRQISEIHAAREEAQQHEPELKRYAQFISELRDTIEGINEDSDSKQITEAIAGRVDIAALNTLPSIANDLRDQIAIGFAVLSVRIYNLTDDMASAFVLLEAAQSIFASEEETEHFISERTESLSKLKTERETGEREVLEELISLIRNLNKQITAIGRRSINHQKLQSLLDQSFAQNKIGIIAKSSQTTLKLELLAQLLWLCGYLQPSYAVQFTSRLKPLSSINSNALKAIEKASTDATARLKASQGCYIATACYGNCDAREVVAFRQFRDEHLLHSRHGRIFVSLYYRHSPFWADKLKSSPTINKLIQKYFFDLIYLIIKK